LPTSIAQQMSLARALTTRPRVLALDEANMPLDSVAELALLNALHVLRGKLTIFVATHRPSLLALCDRQVSLRDRADWDSPVVVSKRVPA
jgi:ABC-type bacteriocin/lantibiotic exporter with double-glycine peptidase domain